MQSSDKTVVLLKRCFSREEWDWLGGEPEFQNALEEIHALDQTERVIKLGLRLIDLARMGNLPSGRPPPPFASAWRSAPEAH